jgi:chromate transporter
MTLARDRLLWALFGASTLVTAWKESEIAGAAFVLGRRAIIDVPTVLIAVAALGLLTKFKKIQEPVLIVAAGVLGCLLRGVAAP